MAILPGTKLYEQTKAGEFVEATERERIEEVRELVADLTIPITINTMTSTSSVTFVTTLPEERDVTLQRLDAILAEFSEQDERVLQARRHSMRYV